MIQSLKFLVLYTPKDIQVQTSTKTTDDNLIFSNNKPKTLSKNKETAVYKQHDLKRAGRKEGKRKKHRKYHVSNCSSTRSKHYNDQNKHCVKNKNVTIFALLSVKEKHLFKIYENIKAKGEKTKLKCVVT